MSLSPAFHQLLNFIASKLPCRPQAIQKPRRSVQRRFLPVRKHPRRPQQEGRQWPRCEHYSWTSKYFPLGGLSCPLPHTQRFRWDRQIFRQLSNAALPLGICLCEEVTRACDNIILSSSVKPGDRLCPSFKPTVQTRLHEVSVFSTFFLKF